MIARLNCADERAHGPIGGTFTGLSRDRLAGRRHVDRSAGHRRAGPAGERVWTGPGGAAASATLLPQAQVLLGELGLAWRDLAAVAFGAGPGAFTGLRTACAVAQGLAFGAGCPVIPVDSLAIVAEGAGADPARPLWVAMDARMDEVYAAEYLQIDGDWVTQTPPALYTLAALNARWAEAPPQQVAGSARAAFGDRLPIGHAVDLGPETDRAAALLRLARRGHAAGAGVDAADAVPVYVRDKVALTVAERQVAA